MPDWRTTGARILAACAVGGSFDAFGQAPSVQYAEGKFLIIVPPEYPESSLKAGETGSVEVVGRVKVDGSFENPTVIATPRSPALELAVDLVIKYWRVQPRLVKCRFEEVEQRVTIWFDLEGGKPKVSYSRPVRAPVEPLLLEELRQSYGKILEKRSVKYPSKVLYNPNTPDEVRQVAYAAVGEDGTVKSVSVMPMRYYADFEPEIVRALSQWRFQAAGKPFCAEVPFTFNLR